MRYVLVRVAGGVFILFGVSLIAFFIPALNTSATQIAMTELVGIHSPPPNFYQHWIHLQGLDQPLWVQYWHWLLGALRGNFGTAYRESGIFHQVSVDAVIHGEVWRTVWLVVPPTILSVIVAVPIGLMQAVRRNKPYDRAMSALSFVLYSTPTFFVCLVLVWYVGAKLNFVTTVSPSFIDVPPLEIPSYIVHHFEEFVLPYAALMLLTVGGFARFTRGTAAQAMRQGYVLTARAKGVGPFRVLVRHLLRPSVIPLIPIVGLTLPVVLSAAVIVESFFNVPGIGSQLRDSVAAGDTSVVTAVVVLAAVVVVCWNLVAHVCTALVDPRVRRSASR